FIIHRRLCLYPTPALPYPLPYHTLQSRLIKGHSIVVGKSPYLHNNSDQQQQQQHPNRIVNGESE
ncbi:hypothetical protein SAMD00019534_067650, partial [Acytostelium subglobosum LB1]|uniref:hypothetical protein n=1 Tax=Acytostelium subglobosum LB1 TaxID=1410327 RepID=UPI0006450740